MRRCEPGGARRERGSRAVRGATSSTSRAFCRPRNRLPSGLGRGPEGEYVASVLEPGRGRAESRGERRGPLPPGLVVR